MENKENRLKTFQDIILEEELLDLLKLKKNALNKLRYDGLPFCKLNNNSRIYIIQDVLDFIVEKRNILNTEA